ncbi:hypothetical protein PMAYCL1PPCAC_12086, partial [Pristionchus mayeri]
LQPLCVSGASPVFPLTLTHIVNLPRMVRLRNVFALCLVPVLSLAAPSPFSQHCNDSVHFDCHDSSKPCIPLEWICDGLRDCANGQDEARCSYLHECSPNQLMCRNGECISSIYRCDGELDCLDGSDEKGCTEMDEIMEKANSARPTPPSSPFLSTSAPRRHAAPSQCGAHEYQCRNGACIDEEAKCDGTWDCPNGDDETECPKMSANTDVVSLEIGPQCRHGSHQCADHSACIPSKWKCDGEPDCDDASDEAHCETTDEEELSMLVEAETRRRMKEGDSISDLPSAHEFLSSADDILCDEGHFRCKGGKCLNVSLTCNGKTDCPLGDDESDECTECDSPMDHKCSHLCTNTPNGHKCSCPRGMVLGSDEWTCEDFDECLHDGQRCSQYCRNIHDGYECSCASGYELDKDRHTCHLKKVDMDGVVFVSLAGEIRSAPMFSPQHSTKGYETVVSTNHHGTVKNMGLDMEGGRMFVAMEPKSHEGILASVQNGVITNLRENVTGINYVAIDWIGGNILYTVRHPSPFPGIYLCKMNGLYCRRIIEGRVGANKRQNYRGLAVNPLKGLVAWIDVTEKEHQIMVANLDGSGVRSVVDHKLSYPSGITFDVIKNEIYFSDVDSKLIEKINLESGRRTTVLYPVNHPYDLAYFNNLIYWTEWGTETLKVASVGVQHSTPHLIHGFLQFPYGIALNHSLVQPPLRSNPCEGVTCPWMCVVVRSNELDEESSLEARCVCPDEYEENGEYNSTVKGSMPCKMKKDVDEEKTALMSHVSVEAMEEYCKSGEVCMNGGSCVEHANTHGRVDRISCKCAEGYGGLWCEVPPLGDADSLDGDDESEKDSQEGDNSINVGTVVVLLLLLAVIGGLIYWGSRNSEEITVKARSTIHRVQEARLPERASEAIKNTTRSMGMGSPKVPSSSFSKETATGATTSMPPPPGMNPPLAIRSGASTASLISASSSVNFSNPTYEVPSSTASPYSGYDEMNTTESSYFTITRSDDQEALGRNPFGRLP